MAVYLTNLRAYLHPHTPEEPAMFTSNTRDSFTTRIVASLVIAATVMIGSLSYALTHIQVVA